MIDGGRKRKPSEKNGSKGSSRQTCLLVLGMHRSGTSALTKVLSIAGAKLPQSLLGVNRGNETGHWEPLCLYEYHDALLAELDSSWYDWQALDMSRLPVARRNEIKQEILEIIAADYGDAPLFVLKEPRICRFAPFFIDLLNEAGMVCRPVLIVRNPLEVCESLEQRDNMSRADAALLWLRHVLDAEKATRGSKRTILTFHHLLENWKADFAGLAKQLDLADLHTIKEITPQVEEFLSPDRRHHTRKTEDVLLDPLLRDWVGAAYEALLILARNPDAKKSLARLDEIAGQFNRSSPLLHRLYGEVRKERDGEIGELKSALAHEQQSCKDREVALAQERETLSANQQELQQTKASLARAEEWNEAYRSSTSWRVTKPLRAAKEAPKAIEHFRKTVLTGLQIGGGFLPTLGKVGRLFKAEGLEGLKYRYRYVRDGNTLKRSENKIDYERWIELYDTITDDDKRKMQSLSKYI